MKTAQFALSFGLVLIGATGVAGETASVNSSMLTNAISLLKTTQTGREALKNAERLSIPIQAGRVSKTEITATRELTGTTESLRFTSQVLIAQDKDAVFQALDLAHELTHATNPKKNPFDPNLNANDYIRHGIEGDGGEAQAIAQECKVGKEFIESNRVKEEAAQLIKARCQFVWKTESNPDRWKQSFYQLGQHYSRFASMVRGMNIDLKVEAKTPMFSSAVAHKPYPLALLEEYVDITRTICNRAKTTTLGRRLASIGGSAFQQRCQAIQAQ